jgi:hypothetical protein
MRPRAGSRATPEPPGLRIVRPLRPEKSAGRDSSWLEAGECCGVEAAKHDHVVRRSPMSHLIQRLSPAGRLSTVTVGLQANDQDRTRRFSAPRTSGRSRPATPTSLASTRAGTTPNRSTGTSRTPSSSEVPHSVGRLRQQVDLIDYALLVRRADRDARWAESISAVSRSSRRKLSHDQVSDLSKRFSTTLFYNPRPRRAGRKPHRSSSGVLAMAPPSNSQR